MTKRNPPRAKDTPEQRLVNIYNRELELLRGVRADIKRGRYTSPIDPYGRPVQELGLHIDRIAARVAELEAGGK